MTNLPRYVYDKTELKSKLSIEFVASEFGTVFNSDGLAFCPFHDDHTTPNLEAMPPGDDGYPWYFCRACGEAGDVIRFIEKRADVSFPTALMIGSEMYERQPSSFELAIPKKRTTYEVTPEWETTLFQYTQRALEHVDIGLLSYSYGFTTDETPVDHRQAWDRHLLSWGWCLDPLCQVVIPHRDASGAIRAVKVRRRDGSWNAYGKLDILYGSWIERKDATAVLLCEGESDCVWADKWKLPGLDCLALPSGASSFQPAWVSQLAMYDTIYLGIDNDDAGERAIPRWVNALSDKDIRRVLLPWKRDLRESGQQLGVLLEHAEPRGVLAEQEQLDSELDMVVS